MIGAILTQFRVTPVTRHEGIPYLPNYSIISVTLLPTWLELVTY